MTGLGTSVRPRTPRSWLLVKVVCFFKCSPALDFQSLSHLPTPLLSAAWGLSLSCACLLCSHAPSTLSKLLTHARKTFLKIPRGSCARPGTSMLRELVSLAVPAEFSLGKSGSRKVPSLVPCTPSIPVGCLGQTVAAASFEGVPLLRAFCCELMADGVGGSMWLHLWLRLPWRLSASEQGVSYSALAQLRALVSSSLRTMYQRTEVNENLPEQNLRKIKRQVCNDASSQGCVYVLCLK